MTKNLRVGMVVYRMSGDEIVPVQRYRVTEVSDGIARCACGTEFLESMDGPEGIRTAEYDSCRYALSTVEASTEWAIRDALRTAESAMRSLDTGAAIELAVSIREISVSRSKIAVQ